MASCIPGLSCFSGLFLSGSFLSFPLLHFSPTYWMPSVLTGRNNFVKVRSTADHSREELWISLVGAEIWRQAQPNRRKVANNVQANCSRPKQSAIGIL